MPGNSLLVPDKLNVTGRGLSPQPNPQPLNVRERSRLSVASSRSSLSDDEMPSNHSDDFTVLDGMREMNQMLVRQIETLRLKIKVDEKNNDNDRSKLLEQKHTELQVKEEEIENLRESVQDRDERIHNLEKAGNEKDNQIQKKCEEIENLTRMMQQTQDYAKKLQKHVGRVKKQKDHLEADPLYREQNEEITKLTEELGSLREKLAEVESELQRAIKVIEQQTERMKDMDTERTVMHAKYREDLEKATKAMRQEVERMREVMAKNYTEMRNMREQNKEMSQDVRVIKEMLQSKVADNSARQLHQNEQVTITGLQRPLTASPVPGLSRQTRGQASAVAPQGPGRMMGGNITQAPGTRTMRGRGSSPSQTGQIRKTPQPLMRESTNLTARSSRGHAVSNLSAGRGGQHATAASNDTSPTRLSPDATSKPFSGRISASHRPMDSRQGVQTLHVPMGNSHSHSDGHLDSTQKNLPPICSFKEGVIPTARQPSGRGGRAPVRRGSAVRK